MKITDFIAALSFMLSIYIFFENRSLKAKYRERDMYESLYIDYLLKEIPDARHKLVFSKGNNSSDELMRVSQKMRHDILYFKYTHEKIYDKLKNNLMAIEDKVVAINNFGDDEERFKKNEVEINKNINQIYDLLLIKLPKDKH